MGAEKRRTTDPADQCAALTAAPAALIQLRDQSRAAGQEGKKNVLQVRNPQKRERLIPKMVVEPIGA